MAKLTRDKWLSTEQFKALVQAAADREHPKAARDHALLMTAGLGGLRCCEALAIRRSDCRRLRDTPHALLRVRTAKRRGKPALDEIALPRSAADVLADYLEALRLGEHGRVFPISTRRARRIFKFYAHRARLGSAFSFHSLRHFRGVQLYASTRDPQLVREALRHAHMSSTEIYLHAVDSMRRQAEADVEW